MTDVDNIFSLHDGKTLKRADTPEVNEYTVKALEDALQDARSGTITSVLVLGKHADGSWSTGASLSGEAGACSSLEMIGVLEKLKLEILNNRPVIPESA